MGKDSKTKKEPGKVGRYLKKKDVVISFQRYAIDAMGSMALGLFASLLMGTILNTVGVQLTNAFGEAKFFEILIEMGAFAMQATGPAMAVAIGHALHAAPLVLFSLAGVGIAANSLGGAGGPLAVLIVAIFAAEFGKLVSKETKIDILVTPLVTIFVGVGLSLWWAPGIGAVAAAIGNAIVWATNMQPFLMGILVSVIVGITLTLPISSAAICAALGLVGLAGGAATAGCCAQMVGFAVMTYKENGPGGLIAQGLGTSMLQAPNIMKNPRIWIPPTLTAAITGPIATLVFKLEMNGPPISSGMGTSGMVGPIGVIAGWATPSERAIEMGATATAATAMDWIGLLLICIVLPAVLTWLFGQLFRKMGWFTSEDVKLPL